MSGSEVTIEEMPLPGNVMAEDAGDFLAWNDLGNLCEATTWGNNDHWVSAEARLQRSRSSDYHHSVLLLARAGSWTVGRGVVEFPLRDNTHLAELELDVHPEFRRRGVGSMLLRRLEALALERGRNTLVGYSGHPAAGFSADDPGLLHAAEGDGAVPAGAPASAFALGHGYQLAQVDRFSGLGLPGDLDLVRGFLAAARAKAGPDYDLLTWGSACPEEYVPQYAQLRHSMSVEVPLGEADYREETWDVARVREAEAREVKAGNDSLVCVVRHRPSGTLTGHTVLVRNPRKPDVVYQEDTLVLPAHRGRSLGMYMKAANYLRLVDDWPGARQLYTWNASENSHMLGINVALGFEPVGYEACWQKKV